MAYGGSVQLPDFSKSNALFDPQAIAQDAARTQVIQNAGLSGTQDLADRATLRDNALAMGAGDPAATATALGANPERATQFITGLASQQGATRVQSLADMSSSADLAQTMLGVPQDQKAAAWAAGRQQLVQTGHRNLPPEQYPGDGAMHVVRGLGVTVKEQIALDGARLGTTMDGPLAYPGGAGGAVSAGGGILPPAANLSDAVHQNESGGRMTPGIWGDNNQAAGPMQVHGGALADVNKRLGTNYTHAQLAAEPEIGKKVGDAYLAIQREKYGRDDYAMGAYNQGPGAMDAAIASGRGVAGLPGGGPQYVANGMARLQAGAARQAQSAPAPVQTASAQGTAGLPQTATDAAPTGPPVDPASALQVQGDLATMRMRQADPEGTAPDAPAAPQNALMAAAPAAPAAAPQNALAPSASPAAPVAAVGPVGLQSGEQWLRNRGTGAIALGPEKSGLAYARDAQGNQVLRQISGAVNEGRLLNRKLPDGSTDQIAPTGQTVSTTPADARNIPVQTKDYESDSKEIAGIADAGRAAQASQISIQTMRDLVSRITPGATGQQLVEAAQKYLPKEMAAEFAMKAARMSDPVAAQEFEKLALQSAGTQEKGVLGSRGGFQATRLFQQANPSAALLPDANKAILAKQLIGAQADADYAGAAQAHFHANGDPFRNDGKPYTAPLSAFDAKWNQQRNPQVYAAAIGALAGQTPDKWAKGLSSDEYRRALDVVSRAAPNDTVQGKTGPLSMAPPNAEGVAQQRSRGIDTPFPVKTAADYQGLRSGATYTDPEGHTRRKP